MLLAGQDLGADCFASSPFVRPAKQEQGGHPRPKGHPARSASVECGISKRPHRTRTQPHLLQGRDANDTDKGSGAPSSPTHSGGSQGLFAVLTALHNPQLLASGNSFSAGQCAPKNRQKSLMEVMHATNNALSHFTSDSDCAFSPSAGSGPGSGDMSPSPPISPKLLPTRPNFGKHSLGSHYHPPEAQRSLHSGSRGNSRLGIGAPDSSMHSSVGERDAGSEDEDGSAEVGVPGWRADCSEGERQKGELYTSDRVEGGRHAWKLGRAAGDAAAADGSSKATTQDWKQVEDSSDSMLGQAGSSCDSQMLKQSSFQNRGPPQHLAASSDVGVKDLLQNNGSVFSYPYQLASPKGPLTVDIKSASYLDAKTTQADPLADSDAMVGFQSSSRLPTGISAQGIGLRTKADPEELKMGASAQPEGLTSRNLKQPPIAPNTYSLRSQSPSVPTSAPLSPQPPPPPQERVSNIHGPPSSSSTVSSNSGSGINGVHCGTNVPLTSKLARMFSGLSNSLSTRMGELTRAAVEGSSGRGGQKGLRGSAASTEGAEDPQKEGAMEEYQAEGLWVPAAGMQHVVPRRSFSCSTLPPLASKASLMSSSNNPSPKGGLLSRAVNWSMPVPSSNPSLPQQCPPSPSLNPPPFPVPCPPSEGPPSSGSLRSHSSLAQGQSCGRPRPKPSPSVVAGVAAAGSHSNANCKSVPLPTPLTQHHLQQHLCAGGAPPPTATTPLSTDSLHQLSLHMQQQQQQQPQQHRKPQRRNTTAGPTSSHNNNVPSNTRPLLLSSPLSSSSLRPSSGLHSGALMRTGPLSTDVLNASTVLNSNSHASPYNPTSLIPASPKASYYVGGTPHVNANMPQTNAQLVNSNSKGELACGSPPTLGSSPSSSYPWMKDSYNSSLKSGTTQGSSSPTSNSFLNPVASELLRTRLSERDAERVLRRKEKQVRNAWKDQGPLSS
mmetsp:Transcript_25920/g.70278  ORF Transcript_25920/g.70278 Transcript_25920/m.70278 type:complete len:946 (+) Transcript_25920:99-2936(+)